MSHRNSFRDVTLNDEIERLASQCKLASWSSFVEELKVPRDIYPALESNRPEMLALAVPRPMDADEVAVLYKLIGGLVRTNQALREHAEQLARLVDNWSQMFQGLASTGQRIHDFANFRRHGAGSDDETA